MRYMRGMCAQRRKAGRSKPPGDESMVDFSHLCFFELVYWLIFSAVLCCIVPDSV